jgi:hypothetical protein
MSVQSSKDTILKLPPSPNKSAPYAYVGGAGVPRWRGGGGGAQICQILKTK